jgi:hypothetical protein
MSSKEDPIKCDAKVCCKASAGLQAEVAAEIMKEDKSLLELLAANDKIAEATESVKKFGEAIENLDVDTEEEDEDENSDD